MASDLGVEKGECMPHPQTCTAPPCADQGPTLCLGCRQGCLKLEDASSSCLDGRRLLLLQPAQLSLCLLRLLLQAMPAGMRAMQNARVMNDMLPGWRA